jgi:hypothetical protein
MKSRMEENSHTAPVNSLNFCILFWSFYLRNIRLRSNYRLYFTLIKL